MSLVAGQRMVRADDGMKGVVELTPLPGLDGEFEKRVVYFDRGEKRIAGKREVWEVEKDPPRRLRDEEILRVAHAADRTLEALYMNQPSKWWDEAPRARIYDIELFNLVLLHLAKRA